MFLDLKFHDIPNTVAGAAREATRLGVFMFNVHASGGAAMMRAAAEGAAAAAREGRVRRPLVIAVTVLTSLDRTAVQRELGVTSSVEGHVLHLCQLARESGLDGGGPGGGEELIAHLVAGYGAVEPVHHRLGGGEALHVEGDEDAVPRIARRHGTPADSGRRSRP